MSKITIGEYDTGFWDYGNSIRADKNPLKKDLNINDAIDFAKKNSGSELIVVKDNGLASVHPLEVQDVWIKEKDKQIDNSKIDRDPNKKTDLGKTPITYNNNVAEKFGGKSAFILDKLNRHTYLGADVDQLNNSRRVNDAKEYLSPVTSNKIDVAYTIADEAKKPVAVEKEVADQVLDTLSNNYKDTSKASQKTGLLRNGSIKSSLNGLIGDLGNIDSNRAQKSEEIKGNITENKASWDKDLSVATSERTTAQNNWNKANSSETAKVDKAWYNLREARMPGIHKKESDLETAKNNTSNAKSNYRNAQQSTQNAESNLAKIKDLPRQINNLKKENDGLVNQNKAIVNNLMSYLSDAKNNIERSISSKQSRLSNIDGDIQRSIQNQTDAELSISSKKSKISELKIDLDNEKVKPSKPNTGSVTDDPFSSGGNNGSVTDDPFSDSGSSGSVTDDPFKNNGSVTDDPFADASKYKNESVITDLENQISSLRSNIRNLEDRIDNEDRNIRDYKSERTRLESDIYELKKQPNIINNLGSKIRSNSNLTKLSSSYIRPLENSIENKVNSYISDYKDNVDEHRSNSNSISSKQNKYNRELRPAEKNLSNKQGAEAQKREAFERAKYNQEKAQGVVDKAIASPKSDSNSNVASKLRLYNNAKKHKTNTVGSEAPLTKTLNSAKDKVNNVNSSYGDEDKKLNQELKDTQSSAQNQANKKISSIRSSLKI